MYKKGIKAELEASLYLHQRFLPLIISASVLRARNCGQVDLAYYSDRKFFLYEIKKRSLGKRQINSAQKSRLMKSMHFIGVVFDRVVELRVWDF